MTRTIRTLAGLMATVLALVAGGAAASAAPGRTAPTGVEPPVQIETISIVDVDENLRS